MQGSNVTFSSDANGVPEPTFSWNKDGSAVTANDRISLLADNKQLSITNVNRTDDGEYICVATNSVGTVNSNVARLTVQGKHITFTGHFIPAPVTFLSSLFRLLENVCEKHFLWNKNRSMCTTEITRKTFKRAKIPLHRIFPVLAYASKELLTSLREVTFCKSSFLRKPATVVSSD